MQDASKFSLDDIYDKNINFLIGSGASYGLFPTLALNIKDEREESQTIETLATRFDESKDTSSLYTLLFMHYYKKCIEPVMLMDFDLKKGDAVLENYKKFLETVLEILQHRKKYERRCNVFTTNYDGCFAYTADQLLEIGNIDFIINDGGRGFSSRYLQAKNFNSYVCQTGVFERHHADIQQVNLIQLHGSAYWYKRDDNILIDYSIDLNKKRTIGSNLFENLSTFSETLLDGNKRIGDLQEIELKDADKLSFWSKYKSLPIVNPTKWKFYETVFEEHYYQMLRFLSYELEKPNSVFITFGFSFGDEHILNLVKRSLSNPTLQLFISCFNSAELEKMRKHFGRFKNVQYISTESDLTFSTFNNEVFTNAPKSETELTSDEALNGD